MSRRLRFPPTSPIPETGHAVPPPADARHRPLYARTLGLRHLNPSGLLCFLFFEGTIALALLLALAELVTWWGMVVLPVSVAVMVKINDVVAGVLSRSSANSPGRGRAAVRGARRARAIGRAAVPEGPTPVMPLRPAAPALNVHPAPPALNVHPAGRAGHRVGRQRTDHGEALDAPGQRARQSGAARYD
jgi:hypothetical protein